MRISSGVEGIARIEIKKRIDLVQGKPRGIEELQINVQKGFNCVNRKLNIATTRIAKPYGDPNILAEFIAAQLKNRIQKEFKYKLQDVLTEKKLHVSNGSEKVGFPYKPFELKLIIVRIQFELFMGY
ncbi:hypothetical protein C5167_028817 [Papaver somniferum]|nr:hypothetical protein C5167_028817 [Papaver somniferum]